MLAIMEDVRWLGFQWDALFFASDYFEQLFEYALKLIRDALVADPGLWKKAVGGKRFKEHFTVSGDSLKRPPKGYDPDHPLIDVLKMKDYTAYTPLTQKQITRAGFLDEFVKLCRAGSPLVKFVSEAIGQPY